MKRLTTALVLVASSGLVDAHHSRANFDTSQTTIITGTLTDFSWRNPHVYMEMEVTADDGTVNTWLVESHSVTGLLRMGWSRDTLQEGETITLAGSADFNPDKHFILMEYVEKADGQRLYAFRNPTPEPEEEIIQPSTDFSGTWRLDISRFNIKEAGGGPPDTWRYTELGQAQVERFSVDDNPELQCLEIGVPKMSIYPYGTNLFWEDGNLHVNKEHLHEKRTIWFDRTLAELANEAPSYAGSSVGRYESERHLVIESNNFLPTIWGNANGVDSSEEKTVREDYRLSEDGMYLDITVTINDPVYMNGPSVVTGGYIKDANRDFVETPCDPGAASRHLTIE